MIGTGEIIIIGGILVLIFGASRIPGIARSLGEGLKEFKKSIREVKGEKGDGDQEGRPEAK